MPLGRKHSAKRHGYWARRPNRRHILEELNGISDDALMELAGRILAGEKAAVAEAVDALAVVTRVPGNVAERLLMGCRAEDYFLENCHALVHVELTRILDLRLSALGFDFGIKKQPERAIEIKGIKQTRSDILFTDREWLEAKRRRENYWLIIVANLALDPVPKVIPDPYANSAASSSVQTSVAVVWRSSVSVAQQVIVSDVRCQKLCLQTGGQ